jgi:hypothetical protein
MLNGRKQVNLMYARLLHGHFPRHPCQERAPAMIRMLIATNTKVLTESELPTVLCQIWCSFVYIGFYNTDSEERHNIEGVMRVCLRAYCHKSYVQLAILDTIFSGEESALGFYSPYPQALYVKCLFKCVIL